MPVTGFSENSVFVSISIFVLAHEQAGIMRKLECTSNGVECSKILTQFICNDFISAAAMFQVALREFLESI